MSSILTSNFLCRKPWHRALCQLGYCDGRNSFWVRVYHVFYAQIQVDSSIFLPNKPGWPFDVLITKNILQFSNILLKKCGIGCLLFSGHRFFHYIPGSLSPLRTIYATRKHSSPSQVLCYVFQTALHVFQLHTFFIQAKFNINSLL